MCIQLASPLLFIEYSGVYVKSICVQQHPNTFKSFNDDGNKCHRLCTKTLYVKYALRCALNQLHHGKRRSDLVFFFYFFFYYYFYSRMSFFLLLLFLFLLVSSVSSACIYFKKYLCDTFQLLLKSCLNIERKKHQEIVNAKIVTQFN